MQRNSRPYNRVRSWAVTVSPKTRPATKLPRLSKKNRKPELREGAKGSWERSGGVALPWKEQIGAGLSCYLTKEVRLTDSLRSFAARVVHSLDGEGLNSFVDCMDR